MSTGKETGSPGNPDFDRRRADARQSIDEIEARYETSRGEFFDAVYQRAAGDAAAVPWADLKPKDKLLQWLGKNSGFGLSALDIACGLGDNAEALAANGYETTAFDLSPDAIQWARKRFPQSRVNYLAADLFSPPEGWHGNFDLVHECYTLQSLPPDNLQKMAAMIASFVRPGGTLLVYARVRADGAPADGPPWPLEMARTEVFNTLGFRLADRNLFELKRPDRQIPHVFDVWKRN